jgi:hypothetical protein
MGMSGEAKLSDFGISAAVDHTNALVSGLAWQMCWPTVHDQTRFACML